MFQENYVFFQLFFSSCSGMCRNWKDKFGWKVFSEIVSFIERVGEIHGTYQNLLQSCFCVLLVLKSEK